MFIKLSHSQLERYSFCPTSYFLHYIEGVRPDYQMSSLFFGSAFDEALNCLLLRKKKDLSKEEQEIVKLNPIKVFDDKFSTLIINGKQTDTITSLKVRYYAGDFDEKVLQKEDFERLTKFITANNYTITEPLSLRKAILDLIEANGYDSLANVDRQFLNMGFYLSMRRKGHLLLKRYEEDILSKITEVIDIQKEVELPETDEKGNPTGNFLIGKIDARVRISGYEGIITFDNKTSGSKYKLDSVKESQQLAIYSEFTGDVLQGYGVVVKKPKVIKNKSCIKCGALEEGSRAKTCPTCKGEISVVESSVYETQVLVDKVSDEFRELAFEGAIGILNKIKAGEFQENRTHQCFQFGRPCPYFDYCRSGSMKDLARTKEEEL